MEPSGHRPIDHTADLAIELWAPDETGLLLEGARAVIELLTDGAAIEPLAERTVALQGIDAEDRLVRWLSEVLYWATAEGFLLAEAELHLHDAALHGTVRGEPDAHHRLVTELKAVTYHDLHLRRDADRVRARVVFDV